MASEDVALDHQADVACRIDLFNGEPHAAAFEDGVANLQASGDTRGRLGLDVVLATASLHGELPGHIVLTGDDLTNEARLRVGNDEFARRTLQHVFTQ